MSQFYRATRAVGNALEPDHQYMDLSAYNNDVNGTNPPSPLVFNESRNAAFLSDPSLWNLSIIRFSVDTVGNLPVMIPQVMLGQADVNKLIYSFTLKYKTFEYQAYVTYAPQDMSAPIPAAPLVFQDLTSSYYYLTSFQRWVYLLNQTLETAVTQLSLLAIAGGDALPSLNVPFLQYDPDSGKLALNSDVLGYEQSLANPIQIFVNSPLYTMLAGFEAELQGYNVTNGKNYYINIYNMRDTNILNLPTYNAIQTFQEYASLGAIACPVQSIVFTTTLLPVVPTITNTPKVFNSDSQFFTNTTNNNIINTLTDFEIPLTHGNEYLPSIYYAPQGEYRLVNMTSNQPINSIELRVYWKDVFGGLHELLLASGCSANIKIMFRKKAFNYA